MHRVKNPDEMVSRGEVLLELEQHGKRLNICSPVSGKVLGINPLLYEEPGVLNEDPYDRGWLYRIRPDNWVEETKSCHLADDAVEWTGKELVKFKDFIVKSTGRYSPEPDMVILQEGGELSDNPLAGMPGEVWQDFQHEFLEQPL
jgi:glycine cleavage system H protein